MRVIRRMVALLAVMAVAGCANQFDGQNGAGSSGAGGALAGSVSDPASPAYFEAVVGDRVLFLVDQSSLTPEAETILQAQADWLMRNTDFAAVIEGHADEQGTREYNLALGARRANAARDFLVSRGVPGGRLQVVSFGKERPIEICSDEACYAKNRRAVTVLAPAVSG
jgi:peptidoglycan-associated lipoprotein